MLGAAIDVQLAVSHGPWTPVWRGQSVTLWSVLQLSNPEKVPDCCLQMEQCGAAFTSNGVDT